MQVRPGHTKDDIAAAVRIDAAVAGLPARAAYVAGVAERGGLRLAMDRGEILGFCCLDDHYFFERAFVSLLIVTGAARRRGVGQGLLEAAAREHSELWTSTNRSNFAMRGLLTRIGWTYRGEVSGLDAGDPEMFYKNS
jgi:ribosomal protein S18 acetylase RimI-like enzyme